MENLDFVKKLIEVRKQKGLTQADVAEKCNITIRTIQRIESGAVKPRSSTIKIISEALDFEFFETPNQHLILKSHTPLWYVKDLFNFKTNTMKKISILTASLILLTFTFSNLFSSDAQSINIANKQKTVNTSPEVGHAQINVHGDLLVVMKNNKYGLTNREGQVIIFCEFDKLEIEGNYVLTQKNNKRGLMNLDGVTIIPCKYDGFEVENNLVLTFNNNKKGLMNLEGATIIPCEYDEFEIENNLVLTFKNNKRGLMNLNGLTIIPCEYDTINLHKGFAMVSKNGKSQKIEI